MLSTGSAANGTLSPEAPSPLRPDPLRKAPSCPAGPAASRDESTLAPRPLHTQWVLPGRLLLCRSSSIPDSKGWPNGGPLPPRNLLP